MNNVVRDHMLTLLAENVREDGRQFHAIRDITVEYGVSAKSAEGSARVCIGNTEVVAGVKMELGVPYPDTPNQGSLMVSVELLPMANKDFEMGPPGVHAIEMSRVIDRGLRESKQISFEKLCISSGEKAWNILIDVYPLNDDGNLFDATALAALAALQDACLPTLQNGVVDYSKRTKTSLPLGDMPITCTIVKIGSTLLVDPGFNETAFSEARLTISVLSDGSLCSLQKGGDTGLAVEDIEAMIDLSHSTP